MSYKQRMLDIIGNKELHELPITDIWQLHVLLDAEQMSRSGHYTGLEEDLYHARTIGYGGAKLNEDGKSYSFRG